MTSLKEKDRDLFEWLEACADEGGQVVLLTLGTECLWQQWTVDAIYNGILDLRKKGFNKLRVVWSLRGETAKLPNDYDKSVFWISNWLPQVECLAHRAVKAGLTHCGFGGTLEFISAAMPVLTFAHFGDQPVNAQLMEDAGMGINLYRQMGDSQRNDDITFYHRDPGFTAQDFSDKLKRLLTEPSFKINALKMKVRSLTAGGRRMAADLVERAYVQYTTASKVKRIDGTIEMIEASHLVANDYLDMARWISASRCCCFFMLVTALLLYVLLDGWVGLIPGTNTSVWRYTQ